MFRRVRVIMWKNSLYNTIGGILKLILGLVSVPFLARNLGMESYGLYSTINAITNVALFSEWSISASITVFLSKEILFVNAESITIKKYNTLSVAAILVGFLSISAVLLICLNALWIASFFENLSLKEKLILEKAIQYSSLLISARIVHQFFIGILQANKMYGVVNIISTTYTIISISISLYLALATHDIVLMQKWQSILAISMIIIYCVSCYTLGYIYTSYFAVPKRTHFKELSKYGLDMWISAVGSTLFSQCDRLIVLRLFGPESSGMYSAITSLCNQINVVSSMPVQPLLPIMSGFYEKGLNNIKSQIESLYFKTFIVNFCIIILSGCGIIFFSTQIIEIIFGKYVYDMSTSRTCLIVTATAYSIYSFNAVGYYSLLAVKSESFATKLVVLSGIISVSLIYFLAVNFGVIGACLGNLGFSLTLILNFKASRKLNIERWKLLKQTISIISTTIFLSVVCILFNQFVMSIILYFVLLFSILIFVKKHIKVPYIWRNGKLISVASVFK